MKTTNDVVVVGAGLSGLAAAAYLARDGREVTVLEGSSRLGGKALSPPMHGLPVNLGPHALYLGGDAVPVLRELGVKWAGHPPPVGGARAFSGGQLTPLPSSVWGLLATPLLGWSQRLQLAKVLVPVMRSPNVGARADQTLSAWLDERCASAAVRDVVATLFRVTTYSNAPDHLSAERACQQLHLALKKDVSYLDGGFASLVAQLEQWPGVKVERSKAVREVHADGRVVLDGGELSAARVVLAVPLKQAAKLCADAALQKFAAAAIPAHAACLDLVLTSLPNPTQKLALGLDVPLYASVHAERPEGTVLHAARYLAPNEDGAAARAGIEALLDAFQPGWRARVLDERFLPQLEVTGCVPLAVNAGRGFGAQVSEKIFAAADWAVGGFLCDGGLRAAREIAGAVRGSVRLSG